MRKVLFFLPLLFCFSTYAQKVNTFVDAKGDKYDYVVIDGLSWMLESIKGYQTEDGNYQARGYNGNTNNINKFGSLFTYNEACKACPNGWRLPTKNEYISLREHLGGPNDMLNELVKMDFRLFQKGGLFRDGAYRGMGTEGCYWTSTSSGKWQSCMGALCQRMVCAELESATGKAYVICVRK